MRLIRETLRRGIVVALVVVGVSGALTLSSAQADNAFYQTNSNVSRAIMRMETQRGVKQVGRYGTDTALGSKLSLPPLPGDQSYGDSSETDTDLNTSFSFKPDFGANETKGVSITLPPLKGLTQVLDSQVTRDLLKRLTATKVPVMMQTYMMVENGAANGFMGGMNIGSNLMSNLIQSQDYQLKLMDITDDTGKMKEAYVKRLATELKGNTKDVWPAALYVASGDDGQQPTEQMTSLNTGTRAFDLSDLAGATGGQNTQLLTNLLFVNNGGGGTNAYTNTRLDDLKKDFTILVGDVEIKLDTTAKEARDLTFSYKAPTQGSDNLRGVANVHREELEAVWESVNEILVKVCDWKQKHSNVGKEIGEMESLSTTADLNNISNNYGGLFEVSSAPDLPMTINVVEQLYKMVDKLNVTNCQDLHKTANDIPDSSEDNQVATNFNDCSGKKGCLKNRVVLHLSYLVARSRTLHQYRALYTIAQRFAVQPMMRELVDGLFARAFSGMDINQEIRANRDQYDEFISYMGRLAQGEYGGGAFMRPGTGEGASNYSNVGISK
jgi:hypothetical protein